MMVVSSFACPAPKFNKAIQLPRRAGKFSLKTASDTGWLRGGPRLRRFGCSWTGDPQPVKPPHFADRGIDEGLKMIITPHRAGNGFPQLNIIERRPGFEKIRVAAGDVRRQRRERGRDGIVRQRQPRDGGASLEIELVDRRGRVNRPAPGATPSAASTSTTSRRVPDRSTAFLA